MNTSNQAPPDVMIIKSRLPKHPPRPAVAPTPASASATFKASSSSTLSTSSSSSSMYQSSQPTLTTLEVLRQSRLYDEERKAAKKAKKSSEIISTPEDGKIERIKCGSCQKILKPMKKHAKIRKHASLNDNKKCDGTGKQGAVVWLSKEEVAVKDREQKAAFNKIHHKDNREKIIKRKKEYRKDNSEQINEYAKQYRKDNSEQINEQQKEYYQDHKIEAQQYYQDNRDRILKNNQIYNNNLRAEREDTYELAVTEGFELHAITLAVEAGYQFIKEQIRLNPSYEGIYILLGASHRLPNDGDGYEKGSVNHNGKT